MSIVKTVKLTKTYNSGVTVNALSEVDFELEKGDLVAIIGDSGSGKSTLLHLLAGVDKPTSGDVFIQDKNITKLNKEDLTVFRRRNIGVIYQFFNLLPNITVRKNVFGNSKIQKMAKKNTKVQSIKIFSSFDKGMLLSVTLPIIKQ